VNMSHKYMEISVQWAAIVGAVDSTAPNTLSKHQGWLESQVLLGAEFGKMG